MVDSLMKKLGFDSLLGLIKPGTAPGIIDLSVGEDTCAPLDESE